MSKNRLNANFLEREKLDAMGFKSLGQNVLIHSTCVFVDCSRISLGSNVRIDPYCVVSASAGLDIGSYVHVAGHVSIIGSAPIVLGDFSGISHGCRILSSADDFSGGFLIGPTVPEIYRNVTSQPVTLNAYSILGANCVALPGTVLGEGTTVGAMAVVRGELTPWSVYVGSPPKRMRHREKEAILDYAAQLRTL